MRQRPLSATFIGVASHQLANNDSGAGKLAEIRHLSLTIMPLSKLAQWGIWRFRSNISGLWRVEPERKALS